jgi:hypothetical protein
VHPDAKDEDGRPHVRPDVVEARRWSGGGGPATAATSKATKTCEYSVVGLVAAGEHRGESFRVCVDKKRCMTHWGDEINARNKRERERGSSPSAPTSKGVSASSAAATDKRLAEQAARLEEEARWKKARPAVLTAIGNAIKKAPTNSASPIAKYVWEMMTDGLWGIDKIAKTAAKYVPRGISSSDFLCHLTMCSLVDRAENDDCGSETAEDVKKLKLSVDVAKIVDAIAPKAQPKPEPKKKAAAKAPAKKAGTRKRQ